MWTIEKKFDFCFGHRVWKQLLDSKLATDCKLGCRALHGHNGEIVVKLQGDELDQKGMIIDYKELGFFKKWLDDVLDHKMILDVNDPAIQSFFPLLADMNVENAESIDKHLQWDSNDAYFTVWPYLYSELPYFEQEIYQGLIFVPFIPTSEKFAEWLLILIQEKLEGVATVHSVEFCETPKSKATFYGN